MKLVASFNFVVPSKGSRHKKLDLGDTQNKLGKRAFQQVVPHVPFIILNKNYVKPWLSYSGFCGLWFPHTHNDHCKGTRGRVHTPGCPLRFPNMGSKDVAFTSLSFKLYISFLHVCSFVCIMHFTIKNYLFHIKM